MTRSRHGVSIVHERKHGQRWYLPAGRVEPGETFVDAAIRETREEAGIENVASGGAIDPLSLLDTEG